MDDLEMTTEYYGNGSSLFSTQLANMELSSTTEVSLSDSINKTFHNIITTKDIVSVNLQHLLHLFEGFNKLRLT